MKILAILTIAASSILTGCVVEPAYQGDARGYGYHDGARYERDRNSQRRDRDGDGVPDRYDRRPDDPRRY